MSRCYGGTFAGARGLANARTLQRKLQRQHTKKCLKQALTFAVEAKRSGLCPKGSVIARDLEQFRESLYNGVDGGHVGASGNTIMLMFHQVLMVQPQGPGPMTMSMRHQKRSTMAAVFLWTSPWYWY